MGEINLGNKFIKNMAPVVKASVVKKATFQDNVKAALKGGKASAQAVLKFVAAERNVPVEKCRFLVKVTLKKMVDAKLVTQLKGTGATGSFKLTRAALAPPKAKKPVKKALKKVTKKATKAKAPAKRTIKAAAKAYRAPASSAKKAKK